MNDIILAQATPHIDPQCICEGAIIYFGHHNKCFANTASCLLVYSACVFWMTQFSLPSLLISAAAPYTALFTPDPTARAAPEPSALAPDPRAFSFCMVIKY